MASDKMMGDYERTKEVILSCKNADQLRVAVRMYNQLNRMHALPEDKLDKLENLIGLMRIKCGDDTLDEGMSNVGKEFRTAAASSGVPELQRIKFSETKKTLTNSELAKKHNVDLKDIKKEIKVGTKIELEHTDSIKDARKIAMDHISEIADYYTDPEYGIIAIEDKQKGNKKSIRLSKKEMGDLHDKGKISVDGVEISFRGDISEDLDYNDITQMLRNQLKKKSENRISKDQIFDVIRQRKEEEEERRRKEIEGLQKRYESGEEDETVEEGTGAISSGSYVGAANRPIRRSVGNRLVKPNGTMNTPIGKMFTYDGETPRMIHEDEMLDYCDKCDRIADECICEPMEEATGASANATYATSGWGKSKFMLTDKGPGKVPVKKTQPSLANLGYQKVRVKDECKTYPYCNQGPGALEFYSESRIIKKNKLKLK